MAEMVTNHGNIDARLQKRNRATVTQDVWVIRRFRNEGTCSAARLTYLPTREIGTRNRARIFAAGSPTKVGQGLLLFSFFCLCFSSLSQRQV
jgi:hypothetical protein